MSQPFFILFFLHLFSSFLKSNGQDPNSLPNYCPEHVCGGVSIRYPFWRLDNAPFTPYCGYPDFGINCSTSDLPIIYISRQSFFVKEISYANHALTLVDMDATTNKTCPRPLRNHSLGTSLFSYSSLNSNLTFYLNCSEKVDWGDLIDCLRSDGNQSYVARGVEPENSNWFDFCEEKVEAKVILDAPDFGTAMNEGFVLNWLGTTECQQCEATRGNCSFNINEITCLCNDGSKNNCGKDRVDPNLKLKIGIGIGAAAFGAICMSVIFFLYHRRFKKRYSISSVVSRDTSSYPNSASDLEKATNYYGAHVFHYDELEEATNNFDSTKELGDGGFGIVYKGKLRDGRVVAIKRLYDNNYKRVEQFMNEVELLTRLHHQNLVSLYGCTSYRGRELLLVYEYISNGTLADHLHGAHAKPGLPSWSTRLNISIETASALVYLHASDVIHRDVKSNNILLDKNFSVKVADFGLSRLLPNNVTHISTAPQGTPGYVDPEYHQFYHLTDKSDVYSFGVVLVELISSKPAVDISRHRHEINLSNMAITKIQNNELHELVDPHLGFELDPKVKTMITVVAELAFRCLQLVREMRPTMKEVLEILQGIQSDNCREMKAEEMDIPSDDALLLKNDVLACSSGSETASSAKDNVSR